MYLYKNGIFKEEYLGVRTDRAITEFISNAASSKVVTRLSSLRELLYFCSSEVDTTTNAEDGNGFDEPESTLKFKSMQSIEQTLRKDMLSLVLGLFPPYTGSDTNRSKAQEVYLTIASSYSTMASFAITDNPWLLQHFEVTEDTILAFGGGETVNAQVIDKLTLPSVTRVESLEDQTADQRDQLNLELFNDISERITQFLTTNSMPLITPFSSTTISLIQASIVKVHVLLFLEENDGDNHRNAEVIEASLHRVAHIFRGRLLFIQIPPSEHQILSVFGINALEFPQIIIADMRITGILH